MMACNDSRGHCHHTTPQEGSCGVGGLCSVPSPPRGEGAATHIGVVVVAVGGQENLPHFLHAAQQQGHAGLARAESGHWGPGGGMGAWLWGVGGLRGTHIFHHVFLQVLQRLLLQAALQRGRVVRARHGASIQTSFVPPTPPFQKTSGGEAMAMVSPEPCPWHPPRDGLGPWPRARPGTCCGRT